MPVPEGYRAGYFRSASVLSQSGPARLQTLGGVEPGRYVGMFIAKNVGPGAVKIGGAGVAAFNLALDETHAVDVPAGVVIDLSDVTVDGLGTAGTEVDFTFVEVH